MWGFDDVVATSRSRNGASPEPRRADPIEKAILAHGAQGSDPRRSAEWPKSGMLRGDPGQFEWGAGDVASAAPSSKSISGSKGRTT